MSKIFTPPLRAYSICVKITPLRKNLAHIRFLFTPKDKGIDWFSAQLFRKNLLTKRGSAHGTNLAIKNRDREVVWSKDFQAAVRSRGEVGIALESSVQRSLPKLPLCHLATGPAWGAGTWGREQKGRIVYLRRPRLTLLVPSR